MDTTNSPLVCNSCSECCKGPRKLELLPEDWGKYREYREGDKRYLARKENQDCIYLDDGCSIYETRPEACRRFDCRDHINNPYLPFRIKVQAIRRL